MYIYIYTYIYIYIYIYIHIYIYIYIYIYVYIYIYITHIDELGLVRTAGEANRLEQVKHHLIRYGRGTGHRLFRYGKREDQQLSAEQYVPLVEP